MNLNGVTGDARKRILAADEAAHPSFDRHPECLLCGRRDVHTHVENHVGQLFIVPTVPEQ